MLRTTQPLNRFHEFRVTYNPHLLNIRWKYYKHRREIYRSNWTGRPGKLTQPINWSGTRRPISSHPKANELKFQADYARAGLYIENLKQPDSFFREIQYPDVTTMDGVLPRYIDFDNFGKTASDKELLKERLNKNKDTNRYLDEEWKHTPDERAKFSWLDYQSSNPNVLYDVFNIKIWSFDRNRLEHFHDYVEKTAKYIGMQVDESYALPNETVKYKVFDTNNILQDKDTLIRHYRIVMIRDVDVLQLNLLTSFLRESIPESVELSIGKHDMEVHNQRYVKRHDIEAAQRELDMLSKIK